MKLTTDKSRTPLALGQSTSFIQPLFRRWAKPLGIVAILLLLQYQIAFLLQLNSKLQRFVRLPHVEHWKDDILPYRQPSPWDISTDFNYSRTLKYEVETGTWLRLDVHPNTGEIVFDMLGDLYCIQSSSEDATFSTNIAIPILTGIPYDADPHFSPDGQTLAYRSDAELGVDNIWAMPWRGCAKHAVRDVGKSNVLPPKMQAAIRAQADDEHLLLSGIIENASRRNRRLIREGRQGSYRITNETYRFLSDPRWHPAGDSVIATKWYTSGRSLGAGEGWQFHVPSSEDHERLIRPGDGERVLGRTLPAGWSEEDYGEQQIGPEQFIWRGTDELIYAKNVIDDGVFNYSKDVHKGIYAIFSYNVTSGVTRQLVSSIPGGASRPELSRDGDTLAFVRRVRDKEALVFLDLESGTIHNIYYGLSYDLSTISVPMGTYPSFQFTPDDSAVIIWAAGQILRVPLSRNSLNQKVLGGNPKAIPFKATVELKVAETLRPKTDILSLQTAYHERLFAFRDLSSNDDGSKVLFQAAGVTHHLVRGPYNHTSVPIPVLQPYASYYNPSFVPHADKFVVHARWSTTNFTTFELANLKAHKVYELSGPRFGRYAKPTFCSCTSNSRRFAFIRLGGDWDSGDIVETAGAGLYIGDITLPTDDVHHGAKLDIKNIRFITTDVSEASVLRFYDGANKLLVQNPRRAYILDLTQGPDQFGNYQISEVANGKFSSELATSKDHHAFIETYQVYLSKSSATSTEPLWSKPGNATKGLARISLDGGHDLAWSGNEKTIFWFLGPYLHSLDVDKVSQCSDAIHQDGETFGIDCVKGLLDVQEMMVYYRSDITRLKGDIEQVTGLHQTMRNATDPDLVVLNATLVTMENGKEQDDVLHGATLLIRDGVVLNITDRHFEIPPSAKIINAEGGVVVPGYIDAHSHWNGYSSSILPVAPWELETFLAYGVTTHHNPSLDNRDGYIERAFVESGKFVGPRLFQTGNIIYGAGEIPWHQEINNLEEAKEALVRIKVEGGPASFSYKNYNLPSRAARQRLLLIARNLSMACVPEGGMNYDWDLTYIIDGMTTVEHALPVPVLYDDVIGLFSASGTGYTPTHIVNYGGAWGQEWLWSHYDIPNDPKLRRFVPHHILEYETSETTFRPADSWQLFNTSISAAKMVDKGLLINIGAHGQHPVGLMYHAELEFTKAGGLSPYETLKAATRNAAITLGLFDSLGSLSTGKLADFLIYPAGVDLLRDFDIPTSAKIRYVVLGGRVYDADTLIEEWPMKGRKQERPPLSAD